MYARSASLFLFIFDFLARGFLAGAFAGAFLTGIFFTGVLFSGHALAREITFDSGSPFGLGFVAGLAENPKTDLISAPRSPAADFSHYFGFEPYLDFENFVLRFSGQLHSMPVIQGAGSGFTETSDMNSFHYGLQVMLVPFVAENRQARAYIKLGLAQSVLRGKNTRVYSSEIYSEKFEGSSNELLFGGGLEFFLMQNYSLQLEAGFRQLEFDRFDYRGESTDLTGNRKNAGESLLLATGKNRTLTYGGGYVNLGLNLNF